MKELVESIENYIRKPYTDYAVMINGVTKLIMMKSDVLDGFDTIKACVAYKVNGEEVDYFPYDITEGVEPIYVVESRIMYKENAEKKSAL